MRKILFNDKYGLTEAVLSGRKTMTRREVSLNLYNATDWKAVSEGDYEAVVDGEGNYHDIRDCGTYKVDEVVAIAQSYEAIGLTFISPPHPQWGCTYDMSGYHNKMFVRADLMPHHIRITNIKVERLQDISNEDCSKEGIEKWIDCYIVSGIMENGGKNNMTFEAPREAFAALIDRISGKGTWDRNPWVFAYEFEKI